MTYTGHKNTNMPDGRSLVDWLKVTIKDECQFYGVPMPTDKQIAVVVRSMRMHHLMMHAAEYDYSELGQPGEVQKYWAMQSSIGRFFRDAPQVTLDK